jgi:hypothetical protein
VLRVSKQIYVEAEPILYKGNKFSARVAYRELPVIRYDPRDLYKGCDFVVTQPGSRSSFHQTMYSARYTSSLGRLFQHPAMGMLRMLTHLTVDLSGVTPGEHQSKTYVPKARNTISTLCLSLSGISKMKELSIDVESANTERSNVELAQILWPLVLLRTIIALKFRGITAIPEVPALGQLELSLQARASLGRLIAKVRQSTRRSRRTAGVSTPCTTLNFCWMVSRAL